YFEPFRVQVINIVIGFIFLAVVTALRPVLVSAGITALEQDNPDSTIPLLIMALLFAGVTEYVMQWTRRRLLTRVLGNVVAQMRKDAFTAAVERDLAFYDENKSGKIVSRITGDTQEFADVVLVSSDVVSQIIQVTILI